MQTTEATEKSTETTEKNTEATEENAETSETREPSRQGVAGAAERRYPRDRTTEA
jgi:hypothetical protein